MKIDVDESLPQRVLRYARERTLFPAGRRVLVAVSGGCDSTVLLHLLAEIAPALNIHPSVLHVDHALRSDSAKDALFVQNLADKLGLPFLVRRVHVALRKDGHASEEAAREARRDAYREAASAIGVSIVATGHTLDDQIETVLMRLGRGAGRHGLAGIAPRSALDSELTLVRPLLDERRETLRAYADEHGLSWREDPSNASPAYLRNRVRHELLPAFESTFGHPVTDAIVRLAERNREEDDDIARLVADAERHWWKKTDTGTLRVDVGTLRRLPLSLRRVTLEHLLRIWGLSSGIYAPHLEALAELCGQREGTASLDLPQGRRAVRRYDALELTCQPSKCFERREGLRLRQGGNEDGNGLRLVLERHEFAPEALDGGETEAWVDPAAGELRLRAPKQGERIALTNGRGSRRVSRVLIDRKIPRDLRAAARLLVDREDRPLWLLAPRGIPTGEKMLGPWDAIARSGDWWVEPGAGPVLHLRIAAERNAEGVAG